MADEVEAVERVARVKHEATTRLLALPGVNLVAVGGKETGGRPTGELVVQVWVDEKRPLSEIPPDQQIPAEIDGVRTDVQVGGRTRPVAAPGAIVRDAETDDKRYRSPVVGGSRIRGQNMCTFGTLGCFLHDAANVDIAYGLTNLHVLQPPGDPTPAAGSIQVGQPSNAASSTACCDDALGAFAGGAFSDPLRDEALVKLAPGMKFAFDIVGIGFIRGQHDITAAEAAANFAVRKRGARTRLTGGVIIGLGATGAEADNQLIIRPGRADGEKSGDVVFFVAEGDSGSVLVDDAAADSCAVTGLVTARAMTRAELAEQKLPLPPLPADGIERVLGFASPIVKVLARFKAVEHIDVVVPQATAKGQVHTVPGAPHHLVPAEVAQRIVADPGARAAFVGDAEGDRLLAPVGRSWFAEGRPPEADLAALRDGLDATANGRALIAFWLTHQEELNRLVRRDRRVGLVWHRGGGAALLQLLLATVSRPDLALPETLHGRPVADCVTDLVAVLLARGCATLGADLRRVHAVLPDPAGRTLPEILFALGATREPVPTDG